MIVGLDKYNNLQAAWKSVDVYRTHNEVRRAQERKYQAEKIKLAQDPTMAILVADFTKFNDTVARRLTQGEMRTFDECLDICVMKLNCETNEVRQHFFDFLIM